MASGGDMHQCVGGGWLSHCPVSLLLPTAPGSAFSLTLYLRSTCICICIVECLCSLALAAPGLFICFNQSASSAPLKYKCAAIFMGDSVNTRYNILSVKKEWACVRLSVCLCVCIYVAVLVCACLCILVCTNVSFDLYSTHKTSNQTAHACFSVAQSIERHPSVGLWQMALLVKDIPNVDSLLFKSVANLRVKSTHMVLMKHQIT